MIILIELQCADFEHEQFNAGLIFGYSLAYPFDTITFFAEKRHIECVKYLFYSNNITLDNINFTEIEIPAKNLISKPRVIFKYLKLIANVLNFAIVNQCNRIVFTSIYSFNLIPLKYLLKFKYKDKIYAHIAMHGTIEFIKRKNSDFLYQLNQAVNKILRKLHIIDNVQIKNNLSNKYLYEKLFKSSIKLFNNSNITYYVFREDSLQRIKGYLPNHHQYFNNIDHPYIYKNYSCQNGVFREGKKIFATLGQGNISALYEVINKLSLLIVDPVNIEIRLIGGEVVNHLKDFGQIKIIGNNRRITRSEIEEQIKDVNYVLFLYEADSYELFSSGSFFDAVSFNKPILFLKNKCLDYYFKDYEFGYRADNIDSLVGIIQSIISEGDKNYSRFVSEINLMKIATSIKNNYLKLRFADYCDYEN
jgi:hypothetical protein